MVRNARVATFCWYLFEMPRRALHHARVRGSRGALGLWISARIGPAGPQSTCDDRPPPFSVGTARLVAFPDHLASVFRTRLGESDDGL